MLLGASLAAPSAPAAVAVSTPAPVLLAVDAVALTTPVAPPQGGEAVGSDPGAESQPASRESTSIANVNQVADAAGAGWPAERVRAFRAALARSSWPVAEHELTEARVACESGYDAGQRNLERNGSTSWGLLMVNDGAHADLARRYDLTDALQNLEAGREVAARHEAAGLPTPWQHCDALIAARARGN